MTQDANTQAARALKELWGRNVREARWAAGLSIFSLAQKTGLDPGHISRIERGQHGTSDDARARLAEALGKRVEDLFAYPAPEQRTA